MILLAVLFHNIQFVLFHLLAEVLPGRSMKNIYVIIVTLILAHLLKVVPLLPIDRIYMYGSALKLSGTKY